MHLRRLDDYQSWALERGGARVLIDPWFTHALSLPPGHWLFGRRRTSVPFPVDRVDAVVLTAHFSDHLDVPTLRTFPKETPVFGTPTAAKLVRRLGFTRVSALRHGEQAEVLPGLGLQAVAPGFPYAHNSLGYVFSADGKRVYLETHMLHPERARASASSVDVLLAPVQGVRFVGVPFVMAPERAVAFARALTPKRWVPTGVDPQLAHGLMQTTMLSCCGAVEDFARLLEASGAPTTLVTPAPGDAFEV
jgi:L-ascorbate metabolism protein UlaG (beta-lactamase superfamily)